MKKVYIFIVLGFMLGVSVHAKRQEPQYKIIANSNQESDIKEMYEVKGKLLEDFKTWVKGVDNKDQVLADHQNDYDASYYNGEYKIILGKGKGKTLTGELKVSYCTSSKEIKKKSFFAELFS